MTLKPVALLLTLAASTFGFASGDTDVHEREYALPKCDKPVAEVMFSDFKYKAADCSAAGRSKRRPTTGGQTTVQVEFASLTIAVWGLVWAICSPWLRRKLAALK